MASIKEVAKLANTSISSVSRVINNSGYVKQETKQKILEAIKTLNYKPLKRSEGIKETKTIGLIVPSIENPFFGMVAKHIGNKANAFNYNILLFNLEGAANNKDDYLMDLIDRVDGLIYVSSERCLEVINASKEKNIPMVLMDREIKDTEINTISINNEHGAFLAVEHLLKLGHKNIAYISGPVGTEISGKRKEGYIAALEENGLSVNEKYIYYGDYTMQSGFDAMEKLIKDNKEITGVLAANDLMAIGAINYLIKVGINVPNEISVVGFDNIELSRGITPSLTTVEYPIDRMSEIVVNLILRQIKETDSNVEMVTLFPKLIVRESSACFKK